MCNENIKKTKIKLLLNGKLNERTTLGQLIKQFEEDTYCSVYIESQSKVRAIICEWSECDEYFDIQNGKISQEIWIQILTCWLNHHRHRIPQVWEIVIDNN